MKYFSMFSGIGGFELGIQRSFPNAECVGYSEIDKYAIETYEKHFPNHKNFGNAKTIKPGELPNFDMLCAGFPCQAFSIAGKRKGFRDTRGTLFFEIARIIKTKRPKIVLLENVKGLLNHNKGKTYSVIIQSLDELGYNTQWMVLNSKDFGVPQNRERIFIIGSLRNKRRPEILSIRENNGESNSKSSKRLELLYDGDYQSKRIYSVEGISPTIPTGKSGGNHIPFIATHWQRASTTGKGGTGMLTSDKFSFTLDRNPHFVNGIRRLTPIECERLQGFPEGWTEGVSDVQRYSQCGNAVTVNVVESVIKTIKGEL
ncbi:DNA (cytosine-5-)-methyltransferase [Candidatus Woesearchaeota archaeon]|nr:MAG: DNA (cytosine-5-)-methyltransferase [Candidatus Woesearchaeota archaeon]